MIYITGDTHGEFKHRFNMENFPEQKEMTKDDYVLICGDFGGVWDVGWESKNELVRNNEIFKNSEDKRKGEVLKYPSICRIKLYLPKRPDGCVIHFYHYIK